MSHNRLIFLGVWVVVSLVIMVLGEITALWRMTHGTISAYNRHCCRCAECRKANARIQRRKMERLASVEPPKHGTANAYINYGCRCAACREDNKIRSRRATLQRAMGPDKKRGLFLGESPVRENQ